jgi:multicomponent Na+:H+ antiporter subunit A
MTSPILETGTRAVFHTILLFSLFMLFSGHNAPGGGFIGGLIAASAIVLRATAEGPEDLRRIIPIHAETLLGIGALIALATGVAGFVFDGAFLASGYLPIELPLLGHISLTSVLLFDIGVYLVVFALGLVIMRALGGDVDASSASLPELPDVGR